MFKSTFVAHYSNESPMDTDVPCHSSHKAEDQLFNAILYAVYDSSQHGFLKKRSRTLLSLKRNKNATGKVINRHLERGAELTEPCSAGLLRVSVNEN